MSISSRAYGMLCELYGVVLRRMQQKEAMLSSPMASLARGRALASPDAMPIEPLEPRVLMSATLVKDINAEGIGSNPSGYCQVGDLVYFKVQAQGGDVELWKTDNSDAGTTFVKTIAPNNYSDYQFSIANADGILYFTSYENETGFELWKINQADATPSLVQDINPGSNSSFPQSLTNVNGKLFFVADDNVHGRELWVIDRQQSNNPIFLKDINQTSWPNYAPESLTNVGGTLYFRAYDSEHGYELWKSDGSPSGTTLVRDIYLGPSSSNLTSFTSTGGTLYFIAKDGVHGNELWKSDDSGTNLVSDLNPGPYHSWLSNIFVFNTDVYGFWGRDFYKFEDGNASLVYTFEPGSIPGNPLVVGDKIYMSAYDSEHGLELWRSNGTAVGTERLTDIKAGVGGASPTSMTNLNGSLYFQARDNTNQYQLWKWNVSGQNQGLELIKFLNIANPAPMTNVNGRLYFGGYDYLRGKELWISDGTTVGTYMMKDIKSGTSGLGFVSSQYDVNYNGKAWSYFWTGNSYYAGQTILWRTDGTLLGTTVVTSELSFWESTFQVIDNTLYFTADDGVHGKELWRIDNSTCSPIIVDIRTGPSGSSPSSLTNVSDTLYFSALDNDGSLTLWKIDSNSNNAVEKVKNIESLYIVSMANVDGSLYFISYDANNNVNVLWKSDGSEQGTSIIKTLDTLSGSVSFNKFVCLGGKVYFSAYDYSSELWTLWASDGTAGETKQILAFGGGDAGQCDFGIINGVLVIQDNSASSLWISNGTPTGNMCIKEFDVWDMTSYVGNTNEYLYFSTSNFSTNQYALWKTDGTRSGTILVKEYNCSTANGGIGRLFSVGNTLYYSTDDGINGRELWKTDGTMIGTSMVEDVNLGPASSNPYPLTQLNKTLLFFADDGVHGRELMAIYPPPPVAVAGNYTVAEGGNVTLSAAGSSDPDPSETLTYAWDLDGDGVFGETGTDASRGEETGVSPVFSAAGLDGPGTYTVQLKVTNSAGMNDTQSGTINVTNVAPSVSLVGPASSLIGNSLQLTPTISDPAGTNDPLTYAWTATKDGQTYSWPEGTNTTSANLTFTPTRLGHYVISLQVSDGDSGVTTVSHTIDITSEHLVTWTGNAGNFLWSDAGNWSGGATPTSLDDVVINVAAGNAIQIPSGTWSVHSLITSRALQISGGSLSIGTTLETNAAVTLSGGTLSVGGCSYVNSSFTMSSGTLSLGDSMVSSGSFIMTGGTVSGAGSLTLMGTNNTWSSGTIQTNLTVALNASLNWESLSYELNMRACLDGHEFNNHGEVRATGYIRLENGATISNQAESLFYLVYGIFNTYSTNAYFNNYGQLIQSENSGGFTFGIYSSNMESVKLNNWETGSILISSGTLRVYGGGSSRGLWELRNTGSVVFNNYVNNIGATYVLNNGSILAGNGTGQFELQYGTLTINSDVSIANFKLSDGTINGSGCLILNGNKNTLSRGTIAVDVAVESGAYVSFESTNIYLDGITFFNGSQNVSWKYGGTIHFKNGAIFENSVNAVFDVQWSGNFNADDATEVKFNNKGILKKSSGPFDINFNVYNSNSSVLLDSTGTVEISSGTLYVRGGISSGQTQGEGIWRINGTGAIVFAGGANQTYTLGSGSKLCNEGASTRFELASGILQIDDALSTSGFSMSGGIMTGTGELTLTGQNNLIKAVDIRINVNVASQSCLEMGGGNIYVTGGVLANKGTISVINNGYLYLQNVHVGGSTIFAEVDNQIGGIFEIQEGITFNCMPGDLSDSEPPIFNNAGIFRLCNKSYAYFYYNGNDNVESNVILRNGQQGIIEVNGGDLWFPHDSRSVPGLQNGGLVKVVSGQIQLSDRALSIGNVFIYGRGEIKLLNSNANVTAALGGRATALSGTEIAISWSWFGGDSNATYSCSYSENGGDYVSFDASSYFLGNLQRNTSYAFHVESSGSNYGHFVYESSPTTTWDIDDIKTTRWLIGYGSGSYMHVSCSTPIEITSNSEIGAVYQVVTDRRGSSPIKVADGSIPQVDQDYYGLYNAGGSVGYTFERWRYISSDNYSHYDPSAQQSLSGPSYDYGQFGCPTDGSNKGCPGEKQSGAVDKASGSASADPMDLESNGYGFSFSVASDWSSNVNLTSNSAFGSGTLGDGVPSLFVVNSGWYVPGSNYESYAITEHRQLVRTLGLVFNSTDAHYFNLDGSLWTTYCEQGTTYLIKYDSGNNQFVYTNSTGDTIRFNGFDSRIDANKRGQFVSKTDAAGNSATVMAWTSDGQIQTIERKAAGESQAGEVWQFTYLTSGNANAGKVSSVSLSRSGNAIRSVEYAYYTNADSCGSLGDRKFVTIKDAVGTAIETKYYRYYKAGDANGYAHGLKYFYDGPSYARLAAYAAEHNLTVDSLTDANEMVMSNGLSQGILQAFATEYFAYDSQRRCVKHGSQTTGCSGSCGGVGITTYEYFTNSNPSSNCITNPNVWYFKTIETLNDGNQNIYYMNFRGQTILKLFWNKVDRVTPDLQGKVWGTFYKYDSDGRVIWTVQPSAIDLPFGQSDTKITCEDELKSYLASFETDDTDSDLMNMDSNGNYAYVKDHAGEIEVTSYYASTTATESNAGGAIGFVYENLVMQGDCGTAILVDQTNYFVRTVNGTTTYLVANYTTYANEDGTGARTTGYQYSWYANSLQIKTQTVTSATVGSAQNGSGQTETTKVFYDIYGRPIWSQDADGYVNYVAYDNATGAALKTVTDVNYNSLTTSEQTSFDQTGWVPHNVLLGDINLDGMVDINDLNILVRYYNETSSNWKHGDINSDGIVDVNDIAVISRNYSSTIGAPLHLTTTAEVDGLGRAVAVTDANGNITYTVYNDAAHETRVYQGWNSATGTATGPTYVTRENWSLGYTDVLTMSATPHLTNDRPDGSEVITNLQSLTRNHYNEGRQLIETDQYFNLSGISYWLPGDANTDGTVNLLDRDVLLANLGIGTSWSQANFKGYDVTNLLDYNDFQANVGLSSGDYLGTANVNYYATFYGYEKRGRLARTVDATGTIQEIFYDGLGNVLQIWAGTDDLPTSDYLTDGMLDWRDFRKYAPQNQSAPAGTNMVLVTDNQYDYGNTVGDGNLTQTTQYLGNGQSDRITQYLYDWRDRLVATKVGALANIANESESTNRQLVIYTRNHLGEITAIRQYDGDGVAMTDANFDGIPDSLSASRLRAYSTTSYDDQGRVYRTQTYSVDSSTGAVSSTALTSNRFYNHRSLLMASASDTGLVTKYAYDGAGRTTMRYDTDGGAANNNGVALLDWTNASGVMNDVVLDQTRYVYDNNGNLIQTIHKDRTHDTMLPFVGSLDTWGGRTSYTASYYDQANRLIASVDVGTNGGTVWTRPSTIPSRSDTALVTTTSYNAAGWVDTTTDPRNITSKVYYDALGRMTYSVSAWDGSYNPTTGALPTASGSNQTTAYTYDGNGHVLTQTAVLPSGQDSQTTTYVYGVTTTGGQGSGVNSNNLLYQVQYPQTQVNGQNVPNTDTYVYNALGQVVQVTDRNGSVHQYEYDSLGRRISDVVTTLGSGVDGAVRRIDTAYDSQGNAYLITSYADVNGTTIANQVQRQYNGLGQLVAEYQSNSGAVNTSTTPKVQYVYSDLATGSRLVEMIYPNGRILHYGYDAPGSLNNAIGRLSYIADDDGSGNVGQHLEEYTYLGLSTVVQTARPQEQITLTYIQQAGDAYANTDGGDQYTGFDRFGRLIDQNWVNASGVSTDRFQYAYDRGSNVTAKTNRLNASLSETYSYDNLNRLTATVRSGTAYQSWDLDSLGNASSITTQGLEQENTYNQQNQMTSAGSASLSFDANGNMTTDDYGHTLVYDAWNRLVTVKDSNGTTLAAYGYDAVGRRVTERYPGKSMARLFYSNQWQVIEERLGQMMLQYVWSPEYVDSLLLQDRFQGGESGVLIHRLYAQHDANYNVTAIANTSGQVVERYVYDAYGKATVLDSSFVQAVNNTSSCAWQYLYQGRRRDGVVGLDDSRHRVYSCTLQRWVQQDPMGYVDGASLYQYVSNSPQSNLDPQGLYLHNVEKKTGKTPWITKSQLSTSIKKERCHCYRITTKTTWEERYTIQIVYHTFEYEGKLLQEMGKTLQTQSIGVGVIGAAAYTGGTYAGSTTPVGAALKSAGAGVMTGAVIDQGIGWYMEQKGQQQEADDRQKNPVLPSAYKEVIYQTPAEIRNKKMEIVGKVEVKCPPSSPAH